MKYLKFAHLITFSFLLSSNVFASCNNPKNNKPISENSSETFATSESKKGKLLYENRLATASDVKDWVLEGPAEIEFKDNWMYMFSPDEEGHHVFWCPEDFPANFIAEWELQNQETDAGLCIVFFSALGNNGESIFDPTFPKRDGVFKQYTKSKYFNNYHISYYANTKDARAKEVAHLRKNSGFYKLQVGEQGIPVKSTEIHKMRLVKEGAHITCFVDERKVIDWTDDGKEYGPVLKGGKIALRQMKWTHFRYRNFKVWSIDK
jgi:hypothetical protein